MFPYFKDGEIVNIKYRTLDKEYRQEKDAEKVFYGLDDIHGEDAIYIVEGEMDKLALEVAGIRMFYPFLMEHLLLDQGFMKPSSNI